MPLWGQLAQHGSGLEQELSAEVAALKDDKQALEEEVVVVRRELAAWRHATRHATCAHVDVETERIKWEGEEKRSTETAMQELTSARQHIWQLHRAASCLSVEAKAEGENEVECRDSLLDIASLEPSACARYATMANEACSCIREIGTALKKAELRVVALQPSLEELEELRQRVSRCFEDEGKFELQRQRLTAQLEAAHAQVAGLEQRVEAAELEGKRAEHDLVKSELAHKAELAQSVAQAEKLRAALADKKSALGDIEDEVHRLSSKLQEEDVLGLQAHVARLESEIREAECAAMRVASELDATTLLLADTQAQMRAEMAQSEVLEMQASQPRRDLVLAQAASTDSCALLAAAQAEAQSLRRQLTLSDDNAAKMQQTISEKSQTQSQQLEAPHLKERLLCLRATHKQAAAELFAKVTAFEEQILLSLEEAAHHRATEAMLDKTKQHVASLECENEITHADLKVAKERCLLAEGEVTALREELEDAIRSGLEQKMVLDEMEERVSDLRRKNLELERESEEKAALHMRATLVPDLECQLQDAQVHASVLQTQQCATEAERVCLENECTRLRSKESEQKALCLEHEALKEASWQLVNAMAGYVQQHQGVGMCVRSENGALVIKSLDPLGAAASSMLCCGDVLMYINGSKLSGLSLEHVQALIRGPPGTEVRITARSRRTGDKTSVVLLRGFEPATVAKDVIAAAEESCRAAKRLQREMVVSKACLDKVCSYHRERCFEIAGLFTAAENVLKETSKNGVAFGREGLADVLLLLRSANVDHLPRSTPTKVSGEDVSADGGGEKSMREKWGEMNLEVDPAVFEKSLVAEQRMCSLMLNTLQTALQTLVQQYQKHAHNTDELKQRDCEVTLLKETVSKLEVQLSQTATRKDELASMLDKVSLKLQTCESQKSGLSTCNIELTRDRSAALARVKEVEVEREAISLDLAEVHRLRLAEERLQAECTTVQKDLSRQRDQLNVVKGELARVVRCICGPSTGDAACGIGITCAKRKGMVAVKSLARGGAADCSGIICVGDCISSVNGESVEHMETQDVEELMQGVLGTEVQIVMQKANDKAGTQYALSLVRSVPGLLPRVVPVHEQTAEAIRQVEALHERVRDQLQWRRDDLKERHELEVKLAESRAHVANLQGEVESVRVEVQSGKEEVEEARKALSVAEEKRLMLQTQVSNLTCELEARHLSKQAELDAVEEKCRVLAASKETAERSCKFLGERMRQCEAELRRLDQLAADRAVEIAELEKDIDAGGKQQELLDETLKLLKKQLEAALFKEAAAVGKAETMQKAIDEAKRNIQHLTAEFAKRERDMKNSASTWQVRFGNLEKQNRKMAAELSAAHKELDAQKYAAAAKLRVKREAQPDTKGPCLESDSALSTNPVPHTPEAPRPVSRRSLTPMQPAKTPPQAIFCEEASRRNCGDLVRGEQEEREEQLHSHSELPMESKSAERHINDDLTALVGLSSPEPICGSVFPSSRESTWTLPDSGFKEKMSVTPKTPRTSGQKSSTRATHAPEVGLGMEITEKKPHRVISLSKDGAALACGQIKDGDILMAIEDRKVDRLPMKEIKLLLRGKSGTKVRLLFGRPDGGESFMVTLTRGLMLAQQFPTS